MKGIIVFWPGEIADIPAGWHLCDGMLGTPDYRNCYLVGAGDAYNPGDAFGSDSHEHPFTGDGHTHLITVGDKIAAGADYLNNAMTNTVTGTTDPADNRPQSKAGCWIMKL